MATNSRELRFYRAGPYDYAASSSSSLCPGLELGRSFQSTAAGFLQQRFFSAGKKDDDDNNMFKLRARPPQQGYGPSIRLTEEERRLFELLRYVRKETHLETTLRVAGGWVRDKLLATPEFQAYHKVLGVGGKRLTSKFQKSSPPSMGRQGTKVLVTSNDNQFQPVDIDIALDDMLGREFADHLNGYLSSKGEDTVSVGVVLKNPEKSKHLETATMKVESFWVDFVNLRAEEYTQDSRIPDLMRIGTASEDAFRRDLTINALFYNINTGEVEDWTGRGFEDLRKGVVATPLPALTTMLDDPLRVLRAIRFAARLRFTIDQELKEAALDERVRTALAQKVSRERIGGEVDLMLRSPDPVGAMRLLVNLNLASTVFPIEQYVCDGSSQSAPSKRIFDQGIELLKTAHDHLADCRLQPPLWCVNKRPIFGANEMRLTEDSETRRLLWYASFLKPLYDSFKHQARHACSKRQGKKANRSSILRLLVDDLKRPIRDAEAIERIMKASDDFTQLLNSGCDISAMMILLSDVRVSDVPVNGEGHNLVCTMNGRTVDSEVEEDPVWEHAMEFRLLCSSVMQKIGPLWRAALILSISEQLVSIEDDGLDYTIEGDVLDESQSEKRQGIIERFDAFATAMQHVGVIGIWNEKPLIDGDAVRNLLPNIPRGPAFRDVMDEQRDWLVVHPGARVPSLEAHLRSSFPEYAKSGST
jgi:tRNA nucleotidyltransferase/poly(A) polymerase